MTDRRTRIFRAVYMGLIALFLAAPVIVVAGVSLNEPRRLLFPPQGLSLRWYGELFTDPTWLNALKNSLIVAASASVLSVAIALPLAWFLWRWRVAYAKPLFLMGIAPFMLPPVITALGFLIFWNTVGFYGQIWATIVSHGIFFVTLPLVNISLGLDSLSKEQVEAARTLGADEKTVFRTVVLPTVAPYVLAGLAFVFVLSLNEYIVAYMVAGFTVETLPIKIFNSLRYGYTPVMAVVAVLFVAVAALLFGLTARKGRLLKLLGSARPERQ
ncbi:MAG: ABC transporter permease [Caenispirillum bisanense]|nr:ABC transporter permease [Caenispirillum bisanense]MCA1973228.1 ABC transporter permease [Caenispirillum sp.]